MIDINLGGISSFIYFLAFAGVTSVFTIIFLVLGLFKNQKEHKNSFYAYSRATLTSLFIAIASLFIVESTNNLKFLEMMDKWGSFLVIILSICLSLYLGFKKTNY